MKLIPTFIDGNFHGYNTMKEIVKLRAEGYENACSEQNEKKADHMIYCHYDLGEDGAVRLVWL